MVENRSQRVYWIEIQKFLFFIWVPKKLRDKTSINRSTFVQTWLPTHQLIWFDIFSKPPCNSTWCWFGKYLASYTLLTGLTILVNIDLRVLLPNSCPVYCSFFIWRIICSSMKGLGSRLYDYCDNVSHLKKGCVRAFLSSFYCIKFVRIL